MAEVRTTFTSDDAEVQRVLAKMNSELVRLQDRNRQLAESSRKGSADSRRGVEDLATSIGGLASAGSFSEVIGKFGEIGKQALEVGAKGAKGGNELAVSFKGVAGGMGALLTGAGGIAMLGAAVSSFYSEWQADVAKTLDKIEKLNDAFAKQLAGSGKLAQGQEVEQFLGSVQGATREQALESLKGVQGSAPGQPLARQMAIAGEVARLAPLYDVKQLSASTGELADFIPDRSARDLTNLAVTLKQQTGVDAEQLASSGFMRGLQQLQTAGAVASPEEALAIGSEALNQNLSPTVMTQIATAVTEANKFAKLAEKDDLSSEEARKLEFSQLAPRERLQSLLTDEQMQEAVLGSKPLQNVKQLSAESIAARAQQLEQAQSGDALSIQVEQLGKTTAGRHVLEKQSRAVQKDQVERGLEEQAQGQEATDEMLDIASRRRGDHWIGTALRRRGLGVLRFGNQLLPESMRDKDQDLLRDVGIDPDAERAASQQVGLPAFQQERYLQMQAQRERQAMGERPPISGAATMGGGETNTQAELLEEVRGLRRDNRAPATLAGAVER